MNKKPVYMKCPRCVLNYIQKKDKFCDVCKREMRAGGIEDDEDLFLDEIDDQVICSVCKLNFVVEGETMCESCLEENLSIVKPDDDEDEWPKVSAVEADEDELDLLPPADDELDEELEGTFAKELEEEFSDSEDLEDLGVDVVDELDFDLDSLDDLELDDEDIEDEAEAEDDEEDEDY